MGFALSNMQLTSTAFEHHGKIPVKHTGEGADVSPALTWTGAPDGTRSFALICHDPDAPLVKSGMYGFVHWLLYNLPASTTRLEEDTRAGTSGTTDFGQTGYGGPMPPEGHGSHHYYFWVLALDQALDLEPALNLVQFLERAEPHLLGMNRLVGTYKRV
ncbi:MAG: YbhB/YbcL family Raf kinase inhibitor-like protein [Nitrococcus sp.]|nr:YbhB/YbcL family Raf kinase inhibitor-like protein [Nitrococcus sp.]